MSVPPPDFGEIRRSIERRFNLRARFYSHLAVFLVANGFIWFWLRRPEYDLPLGTLFIGWLILLIIHAIYYGVIEARERAIEQALVREREWYYRASQQPLPDRFARLSDDGNLEAGGTYADSYPQEKRKRGSER
jgi:hypothetical protein